MSGLLGGRLMGGVRPRHAEVGGEPVGEDAVFAAFVIAEGGSNTGHFFPAEPTRLRTLFYCW